MNAAFEIRDRPTDMLQRQLRANRNAARDQRHFAHIKPYRPHFVREMVQMHGELKRRNRFFVRLRATKADGIGNREDLLDMAFLDDLKKKHPRTAIHVTRGFLDGTVPHPFGFVPNDWDGISRVTYEFKLTQP